MRPLNLTVNGTAVLRAVEPRTHLADFLRDDLLLTATHLGCEQGVCGACTILLDGAPARACLAPAALCEGRHVQTLEGLDDDPIITALRQAFSAEHALQCGYCTPGMLITARDIVHRLPGADDDRVRLELAGNLCRCTGYAGIVNAIRRVLDQHIDVMPMLVPPVPASCFIVSGERPDTAAPAVPIVAGAKPGARLIQTLHLGVPAAAVWTALQDPHLVACCVPGAEILNVSGQRIDGAMRVALGPIRARFTGTAQIHFDPDRMAGTIAGTGRDGATALAGDAEFQVAAESADGCLITLSIVYRLQGPLAQFGRGPIVDVFARELSARTARALEARLSGTAPDAPNQVSVIGSAFVARALWRWLQGVVGRRPK